MNSENTTGILLEDGSLCTVDDTLEQKYCTNKQMYYETNPCPHDSIEQTCFMSKIVNDQKRNLTSQCFDSYETSCKWLPTAWKEIENNPCEKLFPLEDEICYCTPLQHIPIAYYQKLRCECMPQHMKKNFTKMNRKNERKFKSFIKECNCHCNRLYIKNCIVEEVYPSRHSFKNVFCTTVNEPMFIQKFTHCHSINEPVNKTSLISIKDCYPKQYVNTKRSKELIKPTQNSEKNNMLPVNKNTTKEYALLYTPNKNFLKNATISAIATSINKVYTTENSAFKKNNSIKLTPTLGNEENIIKMIKTASKKFQETITPTNKEKETTHKVKLTSLTNNKKNNSRKQEKIINIVPFAQEMHNTVKKTEKIEKINYIDNPDKKNDIIELITAPQMLPTNQKFLEEQIINKEKYKEFRQNKMFLVTEKPVEIRPFKIQSEVEKIIPFKSRGRMFNIHNSKYFRNAYYMRSISRHNSDVRFQAFLIILLSTVFIVFWFCNITLFKSSRKKKIVRFSKY